MDDPQIEVLERRLSIAVRALAVLAAALITTLVILEASC